MAELTKRQAGSAATAAKRLLAVIMYNLRQRPQYMLWLFVPCALRSHWASLRLGVPVPDDRPADPVELAGNWAALHAADLKADQGDPSEWIVNACMGAASRGDRDWSERLSWNVSLATADTEKLLSALEAIGHKNVRPPKTTATGTDKLLCLPVEVVQNRIVRMEHVETRRMRTGALPLFTTSFVMAKYRAGRINELAEHVRNKIRQCAADTEGFEDVVLESTTEEEAVPETVNSSLAENPDWVRLATQLINLAQAAEKEAGA